ncbi:fukutin-related protein-like, partial [Xenia sp. Carnegie-2017]|uniref:fukutin-related protein-like n=1 Tax=Xenia sp. Carnegie-2017 TaxID=2897299 RepID=UPI001F03F229
FSTNLESTNQCKVNSVNYPVSEISLTILIYEFEEFENDIYGTLTSISKKLPHQVTFVVTKKLPYPPLNIPDENIIVQEQPAGSPKEWGEPSLYIKTKYVLILPDATRIGNAKKLDNIIKDILERGDNPKILAFPLDRQSKCAQLTADLRKWTLSFEDIPHNRVCDALTGSSKIALLLSTFYFMKLSEPFLRPFPQALFIQFAVRGWKTLVIREDIFKIGKDLFSNPHQRWKYEQKKEERLLYSYKRLGVKLVSHNGVEKWYGCRKETSRCFGTVVDDMPEYIYNGQWTPPCCMRHLKETMRYVFKIFNECGISYWLEGGSLLGAVRSKDIIPWDYDVDVGIYKHDVIKCKQLQKIEESSHKKYLDNEGFLWEKANEGEFYRVQFSDMNHLHVDIFPFYERNGTMTKDTWFETHRQDAEFPAHFLKPLETLEFAGIQASVPNNYREFLEMKFGKGVIENPQFPNPNKIKVRRKKKKLNTQRKTSFVVLRYARTVSVNERLWYLCNFYVNIHSISTIVFHVNDFAFDAVVEHLDKTGPTLA